MSYRDIEMFLPKKANKVSFYNHHIMRGNLYCFGLAGLLFTIATTLRLWLLPIDEAYTFVTYYPLIVITFYLCGRGPGVLVVLLCAIFSYYDLLIPPVEALSNTSIDLIPLSSFIISAILIGFIINKMLHYQSALTLTELHNMAMLDNELIGILKIRDRKVIWSNSAMAKMLGYAKAELNGLPTRIAFPDEASYEAFGHEAYPVLNANATFRTQIELIKKDKEKIWVDISGSRLAENNHDYLWFILDITLMKKHQHNIEQMAYHDNLTGLPNRLLVTDRISQALAQAKRTSKLLAICFLDLDDFKLVNDQYGHAEGDQLLIEIARRMERMVRVNDTVARMGGDEFVLLLTHLNSAEECQQVLTRLIAEINLPFAINKTSTVSVGASIGVTLYPHDYDDADILFHHADQAMYKAKSLGRNQIQLYNEELKAQ